MPAIQRKVSSKGFTLIELLIVISVIGILAVAVLSAINPVEQIRKGTDTGLQSDASEFLNAAERYLVTFNCYPWARDAAGTCGTAEPNQTQMSTMDDGSTAGAVNYALKELRDKAELKPEFITRDGLEDLYVTQDTNDQVHVCFLPESKTFQEQAKSGGLQRDGTSTGCSGTTGTTGCHLCVPQ